MIWGAGWRMPSLLFKRLLGFQASRNMQRLVGCASVLKALVSSTRWATCRLVYSVAAFNVRLIKFLLAQEHFTHFHWKYKLLDMFKERFCSIKGSIFVVCQSSCKHPVSPEYLLFSHVRTEDSEQSEQTWPLTLHLSTWEVLKWKLFEWNLVCERLLTTKQRVFYSSHRLLVQGNDVKGQ